MSNWSNEIRRKHEAQMRDHVREWGPLGEPSKRKPKPPRKPMDRQRGSRK